MRARVGVALCGAVSLLVLARTAAYYARTDGLALALVLTMTVALLGAIAELLARVARASRLEGELAALPRPATLAAVDGASEPLRSLLRARLANAAGVPGGAPLAGYVVGLLVMLGLLGTFLGLFETLRGAREALTSSGDVEALRAGLAAPMQGLTRSFGTSAAGVSASAMLGLAAALTRQAESRFGQALASYAAEGLLPLTVQMRQLAALERVAAQGEAFPRIVSALEAAASRLSSLEGSWSAAHAEAAKQTSGAIREAVERAGTDVQRAVAEAVVAAEGALSPLVARAVEGSVAAAKQHVVDLGARLDAELEARRADEATRVRVHEEAAARMAAAEEQRGHALASRALDATKAFEAAVAAGEARGERRDAAFAGFATEIARAAERAIAAAGGRLEQADARGAAQASQLGRMIDAIAAQRSAAEAAGEQERAAVEALLAGAAARAEAFDAQARQAHTALVIEIQRGLAAQAARAEAFDVKAVDAHAALVAEVRRITEEEASRAGALLEGAREGNAQLVAEVQRGVAEHATRALALEQDVGAALAAQAERLVTSVALHADARETQLDAVAASVRDAAAGMQAGSAELAGVAEMFASAVDRHREGAAEWLAALGTVEGAIARAANEAASRALDEQLGRARELFDAQLQFHRELLLQLRGLHLKTDARRERQGEDVPA